MTEALYDPKAHYSSTEGYNQIEIIHHPLPQQPDSLVRFIRQGNTLEVDCLRNRSLELGECDSGVNRIIIRRDNLSLSL